MKRFLRLTIIIPLALVSLLAVALCACNRERYTQGLEYTLDESTGGYIVKGIGSAYASQIVIPPQYEGVPVTAIGAAAFEYCDFITSVIIPDSVVSIGNLAFYGTGLYKDVSKWENGVLYIGKHLIKANEEKSGNYVVREGTVNIADSAFNNCTRLAGVILPEGVKYIGSYSFFRCERFTDMQIPQSVEAIGSYAFEYCYALSEVEIPDGVTYFGDGAFWGCIKLERCTLGNGITEIGEYAFSRCSRLTRISIPESVTTIWRNAFENCSSLASVTIPQSVNVIGSRAFFGCSNLAEAVFINTSGWSVSRTEEFESRTDILSEELSHSSTAASYLKSEYSGYFWKRV